MGICPSKGQTVGITIEEVRIGARCGMCMADHRAVPVRAGPALRA